LKHGRFEITVLSDGYITLPAEILLPDGNPEERRRALGRLGGDADSAPLQTNIPFIRHGNDLILVDTGAGGNFQPSDGRLAENLSSLGIDPASITRPVLAVLGGKDPGTIG
jgi:glyoxylase-like metal-dependent hydrolase (beta-lactamase superfamily II)